MEITAFKMSSRYQGSRELIVSLTNMNVNGVSKNVV